MAIKENISFPWKILKIYCNYNKIYYIDCIIALLNWILNEKRIIVSEKFSEKIKYCQNIQQKQFNIDFKIEILYTYMKHESTMRFQKYWQNEEIIRILKNNSYLYRYWLYILQEKNGFIKNDYLIFKSRTMKLS